MSGDIHVRKAGRAGRITLTRPQALNALTYEMCDTIEKALDGWADDDEVALVVIDATGDRAFCSGGDIADLYKAAKAGEFAAPRAFWAFEYPINAHVFNFPKPYVAFMQGYTMGGGVGISCHGSHRVVGDSSRIAMPECGIGLIPDVGGTLLLGQSPGRIGEYMGTTGYRMNAGDAIHAGFADYYIPEADWPKVIADLEDTGRHEVIDTHARPAPEPPLLALEPGIGAHFAGETIHDILRSMAHAPSAFSEATLATLARQSPLSVACTIEAIHRIRGKEAIEPALELEYRFTWRSVEDGDFVEGIRAQIIDKDRNPKWRHASLGEVTPLDVARMLMPLGENTLKLEGRP